MRRKRKVIPPWAMPKVYDIKRDVNADQLASIGAIILIWNHLELRLDEIMCDALNIHPRALNIDVTSRINGFDGKIALTKAAIAKRFDFSTELSAVIADIFGLLEEHKRYRDGIAHIRLFEKDSLVAPTAQRKGIEDEIIISQDALDKLYGRLLWIHAGVIQINTLVLRANAVAMAFSKDDRQKAEDKREALISQLLLFHQSRKFLQPLPPFPEEPPTPPKSEVQESPPA